MNQVIKNKTKHWTGNDLVNIPRAACSTCGGWTSGGGMSHYSHSDTPIQGRTGCVCKENRPVDSAKIKLNRLKDEVLSNLNDVIRHDSHWLDSEFDGKDLIIKEMITSTKLFRVTLTPIE
jgi:hypothetical protein